MSSPQQVVLPSSKVNLENNGLFDKNTKENPTPLSDRQVIVKQQGASVINATANISKTGLGLGMLFMPLIFSKCGVYIPILALTFFGILCFYCWNLLGLVLKHVEKSEEYKRNDIYKQYENNLTMENTLAIVFSPRWRIFAQIINSVNMYGSTLGYVIFVNKSLEDYIQNFILRVSIIAAIYIPLSFLKDIKSFGKFSQIALTIYCISVITIIGRSIEIIHNKDYPEEEIILNGWSNVLEFIGIFIIAYDVNGTVSMVHASMQNKQKFWIPLISYIVFACGLGIFLGMVGYFAFRNTISDIIFKSIGSFNGLGDAILIMYCMTLLPSICLYGFVLTRMIEAAVFKKDEQTIRTTIPFLYRLSIRLLFFASLAIIAYVFPDVTSLFSLIGSMCGVLLTYILPCLLYEKIYNSFKQRVSRIINYIVILIGIIGGILGFVSSLLNLIN